MKFKIRIYRTVIILLVIILVCLSLTNCVNDDRIIIRYAHVGIKNERSPHEVFLWWDNNKRWAVRKGDWKLLKDPIDPSNKSPLEKKDSLFLVNIHNHPDELVNVAAKYPEKVEELIREFNAWYENLH